MPYSFFLSLISSIATLSVHLIDFFVVVYFFYFLLIPFLYFFKDIFFVATLGITINILYL